MPRGRRIRVPSHPQRQQFADAGRMPVATTSVRTPRAFGSSNLRNVVSPVACNCRTIGSTFCRRRPPHAAPGPSPASTSWCGYRERRPAPSWRPARPVCAHDQRPLLLSRVDAQHERIAVGASSATMNGNGNRPDEMHIAREAIELRRRSTPLVAGLLHGRGELRAPIMRRCPCRASCIRRPSGPRPRQAGQWQPAAPQPQSRAALAGGGYADVADNTGMGLILSVDIRCLLKRTTRRASSAQRRTRRGCQSRSARTRSPRCGRRPGLAGDRPVTDPGGPCGGPEVEIMHCHRRCRPLDQRSQPACRRARRRPGAALLKPPLRRSVKARREG
jgi:hypothetical protein